MIKVKQKHIDAARDNPREFGNYCNSCPVARAIIESIFGNKDVPRYSVTVNSKYVFDFNNHERTNLAKEVGSKINKWDNGFEMEPFEFEL